MTRRNWLRSAGAAALAPFSRAAPARRRPNFVVILADDLGYADLGCQGAADLRTPHIDSLARRGVRFTDFHANAPMCGPSRVALMTGRYPERAGVKLNSGTMPPSEITIARLLHDAGYATGVFGKWHLGETHDTDALARGFDEWVGFHLCNDYFSHTRVYGNPRAAQPHDLWHNREEIFEDGKYLTELFTEEAVKFVHRSAARPFFLYLPYSAVHYPMHAPRKYMERFKHLGRERMMYGAMLSAMDDGIGEVIEALRKTGALDNTCILFASDNGATREPRAGLGLEPARGGSNGPFRVAKFSLFEGGHRVPGFVSWPGVAPEGKIIPHLAMMMDVFPTIAEAAGVPVPHDRVIDGKSLLPMLTGGAPTPHASVHWYCHNGAQVAVRRGPWKYIRNPIEADGSERGLNPIGAEDQVFLANLDSDPGEKNNLRRKHPDVVGELDAVAGAWLKECGVA